MAISIHEILNHIHMSMQNVSESECERGNDTISYVCEYFGNNNCINERTTTDTQNKCDNNKMRAIRQIEKRREDNNNNNNNNVVKTVWLWALERFAVFRHAQTLNDLANIVWTCVHIMVSSCASGCWHPGERDRKNRYSCALFFLLYLFFLSRFT